MPRRITIVAHLSVNQLYSKYREAKDAVARSQYQILWLLASGKKTEEVAQTTGYSVQWIRELARRYNRSGIKGLGEPPEGRSFANADMTILEPNRF